MTPSPTYRKALAFLSCSFVVISGVLLLPVPCTALSVQGYDVTVNERFASGLPYQLGPLTTPPVANTSPSFVGAGYDWSGVGWSAANTGQSFALLNQRFFLVAEHHIPVGAALQFAGNDGQLFSSPGFSLADLGLNDLSIGILANRVPGGMEITPYRVLDLGAATPPVNTPMSDAAYLGREVLLYGKSARIGRNRITSASTSIITQQNRIANALLFHKTNLRPGDAIYQGGDSGSPVFTVEKDELAILGAAWTASPASSFLGSPLVVPTINAQMAEHGYALQWIIGESSMNKTWSGKGADSDLLTAGNFINGTPNSDTSVIFKADEANAKHHLQLPSQLSTRGIVFESSTSRTAFRISGSGSLQIGYAGIRNRDTAHQVFNTAITLAQHQNWEAEEGDLTFTGPVSNNGYLLAIHSRKTTEISGSITGSGGLAKDGSGTLFLTAQQGNHYSGPTWIHQGALVIDNDGNVSATGTGRVHIGAEGTLAGQGLVSGELYLDNHGKLSPGITGADGAGTLTVDERMNLAGTLVWSLHANSETTGFDRILNQDNQRGLFFQATADFELVLGTEVDFDNGFWRSDHQWTVIEISDGSFISGEHYLSAWSYMNEAGLFTLTTDAANGQGLTLQFTAAAIPEPATLLHLLGGLAIGALWLKSRRCFRVGN